ncbi:MAG: hypothetical protein KA319_04040 [Ferruginibacter sp.]|nr:hypothetical protein [Ferruginibacter sp.]
MQKPIKPYDNKRIFWDVNAEKLDFEAKANFIIERVFERGDVEDIRMCRRYYGDEKVSLALLNAKWLFKHTMYLAAGIFQKKITDFRCYKLQLLNPTPFQY